MGENKRKHLEMIQNVISRMSNNLFFLRGWTITLIAALFAVLLKEADKNYLYIIYLPIIVFWVLDGYFLSQERLYRSLYDYVRKLDEKKIDFSMDTRKFKENEYNTWLASMFSTTLLIFYMPQVLVVIVITCFVQ